MGGETHIYNNRDPPPHVHTHSPLLAHSSLHCMAQGLGDDDTPPTPPHRRAVWFPPSLTPADTKMVSSGGLSTSAAY